MKYGCRAHDYGMHTAPALAGILRRAGYDACQLALPRAITGFPGYCDEAEPLLAGIGAAFAAEQVEISVLGCYMDLSNPDEETRLAAVSNVKRALAWQKLLGARMVGSEASYERLNEAEKARRRPLLTDSVLRIVEEAARLDATFAIEPVEPYPLDRVEAVQGLMAAVGDPKHLRMIFDPVNVLYYPAEIADQQNHWNRWLEVAGPYIDAMHIKDFHLDENGAQQPDALGCGVMDYTVLRGWLQGHPAMRLLREEVVHAREQQDLQFLKSLGNSAAQQ